MENRKTEKKVEVGNGHSIYRDRDRNVDPGGGALDGHAGIIKGETGAGARGVRRNVIVYGRGPGNWEVLVDGRAVARFESTAEAFQWVEILQGKEA